MKNYKDTGHQSFDEQTRNIVASIKSDIVKAKDPSQFKAVCDLAPIPNFLRPRF